MKRSEVAGCLFLAASFFVLGWIANSQQANTSNEIATTSPRLWLPGSLRDECKQTLIDIHEHSKTNAKCRSMVERVVNAPNGSCKGVGALALQNIVCKDKSMQTASSRPMEAERLMPATTTSPVVGGPLPMPTPLPAAPGMMPLTPSMTDRFSGPQTSWLSPYCVDALKAMEPEKLSKKDCMEALNKASIAPKGECRFDYVMRIADSICMEPESVAPPKKPTVKKSDSDVQPQSSVDKPEQ